MKDLVSIFIELWYLEAPKARAAFVLLRVFMALMVFNLGIGRGLGFACVHVCVHLYVR